MKKHLIYITIIFSLLASCVPLGVPVTGASTKVTGTSTRVVTAAPKRTQTATATPTQAHAYTATATDTPSPTVTQAITSTPDTNPDLVLPSLDAPSCPDTGENHENSEFHTLWNSSQGCHYDHEHGQSPFTEDVNSAFPGFDLFNLLGSVGVGHTNPSSPMENTHKHGGFKWDVDVTAPNGCVTGFEGGTVAVDAYAIQYHAFGAQEIEFEANKHSAVAMLRLCKDGNPNDKGYIYVATLQNYGERCSPYQGQTLQYPDDFLPRWNCAFGPYLTTDNNVNRDPNSTTQFNNSKWTSKLTGSGERPPHSKLFRLLFDVRDVYQLWDASDTVYPFTWIWMCGGSVYNPEGCKFNNSTGTIHELMGDIPAAWDGLRRADGTLWDTDPRTGRITGEFFVDSNGDLKLDCEVAGGNCYPVKLVSAFVGRYSSNLCVGKCSNNTTITTPERDIYFCNGVVCSETSPGAVPSGWIGENN